MQPARQGAAESRRQTSTMNLVIQRLILPAIVPGLFFAVAATPVEVLGCRIRGLVAVMIALVGALAGLGAAIRGVVGRRRGDPDTGWWVVSSLILALPAVIVIIIA
jgi:hypothetical protein